MDERSKYSAENCSIQRTLDIIGEKWTVLILREAFYGTRRFAEFEERLGCARNILSARLKTLVEEGIMVREPYREPGSRQRYEYRLTEAGLDLYPSLIALMQWGDRWTAGPDGPPVIVRHRDCGERVGVEVRCQAEHGPLTARDAETVAGPGAKIRPVQAARRTSPPRSGEEVMKR